MRTAAPGLRREREDGQRAQADERDGQRPEVDRQVPARAVEEHAGQPGAERRAQIVADAEQAEDEAVVRGRRDAAEQHGDDARPRAERQEEKEHVARREDPERPDLHRDQAEHAQQRAGEREEARGGSAEAIGHQARQGPAAARQHAPDGEEQGRLARREAAIGEIQRVLGGGEISEEGRRGEHHQEAPESGGADDARGGHRRASWSRGPRSIAEARRVGCACHAHGIRAAIAAA